VQRKTRCSLDHVYQHLGGRSSDITAFVIVVEPRTNLLGCSYEALENEKLDVTAAYVPLRFTRVL
jgi:hypothetical protein